MLHPLGVTIDYLLIDMVLALTALLVGFFGALWYIRYTTAPSPAADSTANQETQANNVERINMAVLQLKDLAKNVASDVGDHNTLVGDLSEELGAVTKESSGSGAMVVDAVAKILAANNKLQDRLSDAEHKIQVQTEELREQYSEARTDALTGLANRRAFDAELEKNISGFHKNHRPVSLLLFDVDHFKRFNDTHGHLAGDEVLRNIGKAMSQIVKGSDKPCRYGGEEFALVMPNTKIEEARTAAERVRKTIETMDMSFEGKTLHVTASIGLAEVATGDDAAQLIRRSDAAVYTAKNAGRNCGYWHDGKECLPVDGKLIPAVSKKSTSNCDLAGAIKINPSSDPKVPVRLVDLPDRSIFTDELKRRVSESHRLGTALSVMHLRVCDFGHLSNEYGDAVGRLLLDSVAQFVRSSLRDMDLLGKLELGAFVAILPNSSKEEARLVGERIQETISNCVIPLNGQQLKLQLQWGVTSVQPNDDALSMMLRAKRIVERSAQPASAN